jgi:hypothetical protein
MAISDVCKFELKSNTDRLVREKSITRKEAIAQLAHELGLLEETARKKDYRARKALGQIVPEKSKTSEIIKNRKPQGGGKRDGAGRKKAKKLLPLPSEEKVIANWKLAGEAFQYVEFAISQLERIEKDDPNRQEAFDVLQKWIDENR